MPTRYIVRPIDGPNQVYDDVGADATVGHLKERIFVAEGTPVEDQKLIYASQILEGQFLRGWVEEIFADLLGC